MTSEYFATKEQWYEDIRRNQETASQLEEEIKQKGAQIVKLKSSLADADFSIHNPERGLQRQLVDLRESIEKINTDAGREKKRADAATLHSEQLRTRLQSLFSDCEDKNVQILNLLQEKADLQGLNDALHAELDGLDQIEVSRDEERALKEQAEKQLLDINTQLEEIFKDFGRGLGSQHYLELVRGEQTRRDESQSSLGETPSRRKLKDRIFSNTSLHEELAGLNDSATEDESDDGIEGGEVKLPSDEDKTLDAKASNNLNDDSPLTEQPRSETVDATDGPTPPELPDLQPDADDGIDASAQEEGFGPDPRASHDSSESSSTDDTQPTAIVASPDVDEKAAPEERQSSGTQTSDITKSSSTDSVSSVKVAKRKSSERQRREQSPEPFERDITSFEPTDQATPTSYRNVHNSTFDCWSALPTWVKLYLFLLFFAMTKYALYLRQQALWDATPVHRIQSFATNGIERWLGVDHRMLG